MKYVKGLSKVVLITLCSYILVLIGLAILYYPIHLIGYNITFISGGIIQTIPFILISWIVWRLLGKGKWSIGFKRSKWVKDLMIGLGFGFLLITTTVLIIWITQTVAISEFALDKDLIQSIISLLILFTMVGLSEEMFSRGLIQGMTKYYLGRGFAIVFSSILFALLHLGNEHFTFNLPFVNLLLAGVMFALFREWKESIWLPIGFHITWNFFQGPIYGFPVSGIPLPSLFQINQEQESTLLNGGLFGVEGSIITTLLLSIVCAYIIYRINSKRKPTFTNFQ